MNRRLDSHSDALRALVSSRKLRNREYRRAMVDAELRHGLADQIRAMREKKGWSESDLASHVGGSYATHENIESSRDNYASLPDLLAIANAFDVGLAVRFVPFSELVSNQLDESECEQAPSSFEEEIARA